MLELFTNPGFLAAGGALVSAPVIIHLINRMRFRRVKWAAMEFLLKSQKRNRRRLIIEQLILLMLRCLLVILAALLVLRFVGLSFAGFSKQAAMHVIVLDDTLSMNDHWKEGGETRTAFAVAKKDVILDNIIRKIGQSSTADRVTLIPLSKLAAEPGYQPKVYGRLNDQHTVDDISRDLDDLACSKLHVPLVEGVKRAQKIRDDDKDTRTLVYLVSDFRSRDWKGAEAKALHDGLVKLAKEGAKVHLIDTVFPYRQANERRVPQSRDNLAIVELRPETRMAGVGMPVIFTCTVANFTAVEQKLHLDVYDYDDPTGKEMLQELFFSPSLPLSVPANGTATVSFEVSFNPTLGDNEKYFAKIYAKLKTPQRNDLTQDGLIEDNVRHAVVEIRKQVPVLVVDGEGDRGRSAGKDSFHLEYALRSVPGSGGYEITQGEQRLLERPNLGDYASIYLLNVPRLNEKQEKALEGYVQNGGGAAFFMGPLVSSQFYNKNLYNKGKGLFPVPLAEQYFPLGDAERVADFNVEQILLRREQFANAFKFPIFGQVFREEKDQEVLRFLPIKRYWPVPRDQWQPTPGQTEELATLPNERPISAYADRAAQIVKELPTDNPEYKKYSVTLKRYRDKITTAIAPGSETRPYALAAILKDMLEDRGADEAKEKDAGGMVEFWASPDPKIRSLRLDVTRLRDEVLYGDPFVITHRYGKGRTVAVMTTAGKDWNNWGGGSPAEITYVPFVLEVQSYLSSQGAEANRMVGSAVTVEADAKRYAPKGKAMKLIRWFYKPQSGKATEWIRDRDEFVKEEGGKLKLVLDKNMEPGFYGSYLVPDEPGARSTEKGDRARAVASWGHVFNVDTAAESDLQRVTQDEMDSALREAPAGLITQIQDPHGEDVAAENKQTDLSELAWFFLIFLLVLTAEQALAVHLSFHLRSGTDEAALPTQAVAPTANLT